MDSKVSDFLKKNIRYIAAVLVGIVLLTASSWQGSVDNCGTMQKELKKTLEMAEGVGNVEVMVTYNEDGTAKGAIIVADGANNTAVKKLLHDCAAAVLGVPDYKIQVLNKKE